MKLLACILLTSTLCGAQDFWTKERKAVTTGIVAESIVDDYTTQVLLNRGGVELNPLARPMVTHGTAGQVAACAVGVGAVVGVQYLAHRTGHPKAANWIGRIVLVAEGVNVGRQIYLLKKY